MTNILMGNPPKFIYASLFGIFFTATVILSYPYDPKLQNYNINLNQSAGNNVLYYYSDWPEKSQNTSSYKYTPSPTNWRELPTYTVILDRFSDGDPSNNDFYGHRSEWDVNSNQLRHGGDILGLAQDRVLDYIHGMGYRTIYIAGTPWLNMPWQADGYSALDFTLLDPHWGTLSDWRAAIDKIHSKGMYVMLDTTTTTLADFIGFKEYPRNTAPFNLQGYEVHYKPTVQTPWDLTFYSDFNFTNTRDPNCQLPKFYYPNGSEAVITDEWKGCYTGDFDQFGDSGTLGTRPEWQDQLTKYSSVQDRLRDWDSTVAAKLENLACMTLRALDPDAMRVDKASQQTLGFLGKWGGSLRTCAKSLGKNNFFIPGEISGANTFGSLYYGRGRQPVHYAQLQFDNIDNIKPNQSEYFMRPLGENALDSSAFHYSIYRSLTRFLGMDGELDSPFDVPVNWVDAWRRIYVTTDFLNQQTAIIDPRHLYGTTNQDNFRWPSIVNGTHRFLLGQLITNLMMPGIPLALYGEEQGFYLFDSQANDYLFGRQPMSSSLAWMAHGCYKLGSKKYPNFPLDKALKGCTDAWNSLDHYDPTSGIRNILARFVQLRSQYASLQDGFNLTQLGNWTTLGELPASSHTPSEWGLWSVSRSPLSSQRLDGPHPELPVWVLYSNVNQTTEFSHDCSTNLAILSPYPAPTSVRNLIYPYENYSLEQSQASLTADSSLISPGCLKSIKMEPFSYKVLVPDTNWVPPLPRLVGFEPGHDARLWSASDDDNAEISISLFFSEAMSCQAVSSSLSLSYTISPDSKAKPRIALEHAVCSTIDSVPSDTQAAPPAIWKWTSSLSEVSDGVYEIIINNATSESGSSTNTIDHLIFRRGGSNNPIAFPNATYSSALLQEYEGKKLIHSNAAGADKMRYSTDFGQSYSKWVPYSNQLILPSDAFAPPRFWQGYHIRVQYWSQRVGSAAHMIDGDLGYESSYQRRFPQLLLRGAFNQWGYDKGIPNVLTPSNGMDNLTIDVITDWPHEFQLTVFDTRDPIFYGDVDKDGVLDLLPPNSQARNYLYLPQPNAPFLGWRIMVNTTTMTWGFRPIGHERMAIMLFVLLALIPPSTALLACWMYQKVFYKVKFNKYGDQKEKRGWIFSIRNIQKAIKELKSSRRKGKIVESPMRKSALVDEKRLGMKCWPDDISVRRKVLIATLEYEIIDWNIKVKIGGLGVMSSLMGKQMTDVDLLWVIPKVSDLKYPEAEPALPIKVVVFGEIYLVECQIHKCDNITYFLLDSPVFRANSTANPYPARMDDLSSAIFYSHWNQCIAEICRRTPDLSIYHINDYHGALAPLYLLPSIIPVCLSLHNAEFQGLWPLAAPEEEAEVCQAFNITEEICAKYARFGNVFNLLHAAASYISQHQDSVGVAGVSEKYGKRSWARYPALWTLKTIDPLPNPDPKDVEALDAVPRDMKSIKIDPEAERRRLEDKRQLQEWAGLEINSQAQIFFFLGRWSFQKGVDLIADVFLSILEKHLDVQLVTVGPVIDLYGKFAAIKLERLMKMYPKRVLSRPEFVSLPSCVFSGSDFSLIPSRDEPFGLVAVEFGRQGALGVGSRLGGLGLMPGWWFPVESDSTAHLHSQLLKTIKLALNSSHDERALLRARSAQQRFPVLEWRNKMEIMHARSIRASRKYAGKFAFNNGTCLASQKDGTKGGESEILPSGLLSPSTGSSKLPQSQLSSQPGEASLLEASLTSSKTKPTSVEALSVSESFPQFKAKYLEGEDKARIPSQEMIFPHSADGDQEFLKTVSETEKAQDSNEFKKSVARKADANSPLNQIVKDFTDEDGKVTQEFTKKLEALTSENSQSLLCISSYIVSAEKAHFKQLRQEVLELARSRYNPSPLIKLTQRWKASTSLRNGTTTVNASDERVLSTDIEKAGHDQPFLTMASKLNLWQIRLQNQLLGWPIYTIILAIGQIMSATSFQLSLLNGTSTRSSVDLYVIGAANIFGSIFWYRFNYLRPAIWSLSAPWIFFGLAFVLVGLPSLSNTLKIYSVRHPLTLVASSFYSIASAAGFLFFSSNFGEEAGGTTDSWVYRACIVQGTQQIWVAALWYWGFKLQGVDPVDTALVPPAWMNVVTLGLGSLCFFVAYVLFSGLPKYYRNAPGTVPNFTRALFRRKLVMWYLAAEILRNYWLSGPYGRNWTFLWTRDNSPFWSTLLLLLFFFVGVWGALVWGLGCAARKHTWAVAIFAVGLGAPRWCQMLWGTSSVASYLSWAGNAGPQLATSLWLWLGVLDAVQGVGLGIILLQTLSRVHVTATLCLAQIIGSTAVLVARATAPDRIGPESVFPDLGLWDPRVPVISSPVASWPFWLALICQLIIVAGYFVLFRHEQLSKP
ncbi:hypothetical protein O181_015752 [Austropuccinia psidii MF-1]|uniref:alpha-1,3-glucan synthase n=1 Tax=Austropuccinia psidii MF-1 TaxID=1389203 RepID=A0A9Q3GR18_9BASI|nr:hypothetical protein [Austropuccinia psidii MF-1]